jgi:hypothetical protein
MVAASALLAQGSRQVRDRPPGDGVSSAGSWLGGGLPFSCASCAAMACVLQAMIIVDAQTACEMTNSTSPIPFARKKFRGAC